MEVGFFCDGFGYWQAIVTPCEETRDAYPEGTVEVPLKPATGYEWNGTDWVAPAI